MDTRIETLLALSSLHPNNLRTKHIAGLFIRNRLMAVGFNRRKSHPFQKKFGRNEHSIYLHAEIDAIVSASRLAIDFERCDLIVIRLKPIHRGSKKEKLSPSAPCKGCTRCISAFGIKNVIHS